MWKPVKVTTSHGWPDWICVHFHTRIALTPCSSASRDRDTRLKASSPPDEPSMPDASDDAPSFARPATRVSLSSAIIWCPPCISGGHLMHQLAHPKKVRRDSRLLIMNPNFFGNASKINSLSNHWQGHLRCVFTLSTFPSHLLSRLGDDDAICEGRDEFKILFIVARPCTNRCIGQRLAVSEPQCIGNACGSNEGK